MDGVTIAVVQFAVRVSESGGAVSDAAQRWWHHGPAGCSDAQTASDSPVDLKSAVRYIQSVFASFAAGIHFPVSCGHVDPLAH